MRQIMSGCQGGRVKWVGDTQTLWESFFHIGRVANNIVATDAILEIIFSPQTTPGDAVRFEPGTHWFGTVDDQSKRFQMPIGGLEKERVYIFAFEARLYPAKNHRQHVATAILRYSFQGDQKVMTQDVFVDRMSEERLHKQVDTHVEYIFHILDGLRTNDPQVMIAGYQARLEILRNEGGDPDQIDLLERAIEKIMVDGTLEGLSEYEKRRLRADSRSTMKLLGF